MSVPEATRYTYVVEGRGQFPFDMLRYDSAWPLHERDSGMIEACGRGRTPAKFVRISLKGVREPTAARWSSFGWTVIDQYVRKVAA